MEQEDILKQKLAGKYFVLPVCFARSCDDRLPSFPMDDFVDCKEACSVGSIYSWTIVIIGTHWSQRGIYDALKVFSGASPNLFFKEITFVEPRLLVSLLMLGSLLIWVCFRPPGSNGIPKRNSVDSSSTHIKAE